MYPIVKGKYAIPSPEGDYQQVSFDTLAESVKENTEKNFISLELKQHLLEIKDQEVLKGNISNSISDKRSDQVPSSLVLNKLAQCLNLGTIKIIISKEQPPVEPGMDILWIKEE